MNRLLSGGAQSSAGIIIGFSLLVIQGLSPVTVFSSARAPSASPQDTGTPSPSSEEAPAATVNGYVITQSHVSQTISLNVLLQELSKAGAISTRESVERLIRSQLILQGAPGIDQPTQEDVGVFIGSLIESWGVSEEEVDKRLQAAGLGRSFLEATIKRLLTVQAGVESLENEGYVVSDWLLAQEQNADIRIHEDVAGAEDWERRPEPDHYEPDDAQHQAKVITTNGLAQKHNFHAPVDEDWVKFSASAGSEYIIRTIDLEFSCDTVLSVYDASGILIAIDDNAGVEPLASRIDWTSKESGVHYVSVSHRNPWMAGNLEYSLEINESGPSPTVEEPIASPTSDSTTGPTGSGQIPWGYVVPAIATVLAAAIGAYATIAAARIKLLKGSE